jgi:hypothetical protein
MKAPEELGSTRRQPLRAGAYAMTARLPFYDSGGETACFGPLSTGAKRLQVHDLAELRCSAHKFLLHCKLI